MMFLYICGHNVDAFDVANYDLAQMIDLKDADSMGRENGTLWFV